MRIDQRNAGASVTVINSATYAVDRFAAFRAGAGATITAQRSTTAPDGFTNSLLISVTAGATPATGAVNAFWQNIEGFNVGDLGWGAANAKSITVSFWVRCSVTGTYAISLNNNADNRFYVATYSISSANTWEYKTITIPGDTSGTWTTDNTKGIQVAWDIGYGTDFNVTAGAWGASGRRTSSCVQLSANTGATFYITGVQLEVGSVATPFERRQYGQELALCQRYLPAFNSASTVFGIGPGYTVSTTSAVINCPYVVTPRVSPTGITVSNASHITFTSSAGSFVFSAAFFGSASSTAIGFISGTISGATAGQGGAAYFNSTSGQLLFTGCEL